MPRAIAVSVFGGWIVGATVLVLLNVLTRIDDQVLALVDVDAIARGRVHELLFHFEVWGRGLGQLPAAATFVQLDALVTTALLAMIGYRILHRRDRLSPANVGLFVLNGALLFYVLGSLWLAMGMATPETCGEWLAWMLVGLFYAAALSVLCGLGEWFQLRRQSRVAQAAAALSAS